MIIEYNQIYDEQIKDLLVKLQDYMVNIDEEGYSVLTDEYREEYFKKTIEEIKKYEGKMLLYKDNNEILGLIVGLINNEETKEYDFQAPKRGRITELIVIPEYRNKGIGKQLLDKITEYFKEKDCKDILISVFAYNEASLDFYKKNNYHARLIEMTKKIEEN